MTRTKSSKLELKSQPPPGVDLSEDETDMIPITNNPDKVREELYHLCTLLNVDNTSIVGSAMHILNRMERAFQSEGEPFIFPKPIHMAFAIWDALSLHACPRSPRTIAECCGVDPKKILHLETRLLKNKFYTKGTAMKSHSIHPPSMYCETACDILYIPFGVTRIIKAVVTRYEDQFEGCRPEGVVAAAILLVCNQFRKLNVNTPKLVKMKNEILHLD